MQSTPLHSPTRQLRYSLPAIAALALSAASLCADPASELIREARAVDCKYCACGAFDRADAIGLYERALEANPTPEQRLDVLWRLARLHGENLVPGTGQTLDLQQASTYCEAIMGLCKDDGKIRREAALAAAKYANADRRFLAAMRYYNAAIAIPADPESTRRTIGALARTARILDASLLVAAMEHLIATHDSKETKAQAMVHLRLADADLWSLPKDFAR